jgi:hypothetical protein
MKAKALLLTCALAVAALAVQDPVQFSRTYKVGEKDVYKFKFSTSIQLGDAEGSSTLTHETMKVHENGDGEVQFTTSDLKILLNGGDVTDMVGGGEKSSRTVTMTKAGLPREAKGVPAGVMDAINVLISMSTYLGEKPMKVGEPNPITVGGTKEMPAKATGTLTLKGVTAGVATLVYDLQISNHGMGDTTFKVKMTSLIDATTSKLNKVEGTAADVILGDMELKNFKFSSERVVKAEK